MKTKRGSGGTDLLFIYPGYREGMGVQRDDTAALPPVKIHDTHCSTVRWVGLGTGLGGYRKYRLNWDHNPDSPSTFRVAIPNTLPRLRYSTQLAINHCITKLIPCYQKPDVWNYDLVSPFHLHSRTCCANSITLSDVWLHSKLSFFVYEVT